MRSIMFHISCIIESRGMISVMFNISWMFKKTNFERSINFTKLLVKLMAFLLDSLFSFPIFILFIKIQNIPISQLLMMDHLIDVRIRCLLNYCELSTRHIPRKNILQCCFTNYHLKFKVQRINASQCVAETDTNITSTSLFYILFVQFMGVSLS